MANGERRRSSETDARMIRDLFLIGRCWERKMILNWYANDGMPMEWKVEVRSHQMRSVEVHHLPNRQTIQTAAICLELWAISSPQKNFLTQPRCELDQSRLTWLMEINLLSSHAVSGQFNQIIIPCIKTIIVLLIWRNGSGLCLARPFVGSSRLWMAWDRRGGEEL